MAGFLVTNHVPLGSIVHSVFSPYPFPFVQLVLHQFIHGDMMGDNVTSPTKIS